MLRTFLKAVYAGAAIGLGGFLFLSSPDKVTGAGLFSIGLLTVLIFGFELFTGRVCSVRKRPLEWPLIWIGNSIGAGIVAMLTRTDAAAVVSSKLSKPLQDLFFDGITCGALIAVSVMGYKRSRSLLIPIFGVMAFVLSGSEHCVADAFYFLSCGIFPVRELLVITAGNMVGGALMGIGIENLGDGAM